MGKLGFFLSVGMISVIVISLIMNIHLYTIYKRLNNELSRMEFGMHGYTYAAYSEFENETQEYAPVVWDLVKNSEEAKFVISEESFSVIVYIHPYSVGLFDSRTAEWIVIASSISEMTNETRIAIIRLDYQTLGLKKAYKSSHVVGEGISLEESTAIMESEISKEEGEHHVISEKVKLICGNYVYSHPASDFGGTIIVNKYAGITIFYATTIWDGKGRLVIPEE